MHIDLDAVEFEPLQVTVGSQEVILDAFSLLELVSIAASTENEAGSQLSAKELFHEAGKAAQEIMGLKKPLTEAQLLVLFRGVTAYSQQYETQLGKVFEALSDLTESTDSPTVNGEASQPPFDSNSAD